MGAQMPSTNPTESKFASEQFRLWGWTYFIVDDRYEDEVHKLDHFIVSDATGQTVEVPFSPYKVMTRDDVFFFILLGFPAHGPSGAFDSQQLRCAWLAKEGPSVGGGYAGNLSDVHLETGRFAALWDGGNVLPAPSLFSPMFFYWLVLTLTIAAVMWAGMQP
jgi:hypothetical protein